MLRLKELRKSRGMTQEELGDRIGMKKASVSFYETGRQEPSLETLKKIAEVLEVSTDALIGYENQLESFEPHTTEARLLASGVDRMPREQRERALKIMQTIFDNYSDYFKKGNEQ